MRAGAALEINEHYLKLVAAESFVKQRQISDRVAKPISGLNEKQVTGLILSTLQDLKIKPHPLVLCIPRNLATVRNLHLPSQDKKEIAQMLQLHIARITPYKKEEMVFDYSILGSDEINYTKVMLAIVSREIIKRQIRILEAANLFVDRISLSSYGVWERVVSIQKQQIIPSEVYLTLDVDTDFADFIIFDREHLLFSRSIAVELKEMMQPADITKFIGEVRQSLVIFHSEESNKNPLKIFLSGAAITEALQKTMQGEFDAPVECLLAPFKGIPPTVSLTAISQFLLEVDEKGISFSLPEMQIKKALRDRTRELMILGSLAIYIFMSTFLYLWAKVGSSQSYLKRLSEHNGAVEREVGGLVRDYKRILFIKDFISNRRILSALLAELLKLTPQQISIDSVKVDEAGKVSIMGQSTQLSAVFKFITTIENSKYFKDASAKSTRTKKMDDRDITKFEIVFSLTTEELAAKK